MQSHSDRDNYRYWQQKGGDWERVYDERRRRHAYYDLQELAIVEYVAANRPGEILEVGMGVGRHVRNLRMLCETFGFDQSPTMFEVVRRSSDPAWFDSHCLLGTPDGPLPYEDDRFDLVFTSEVLVHIHPDDLRSRLSEMVRVARWQVFHIEPSSPEFISSDAHHGCWYHDLEAAYAALGHRCERLEPTFKCQSMWRVVLDGTRPASTYSTAFAAISRAIEADLQPGLDEGARLAGLDLERRVDELSADRDRLWAEVGTWKRWSEDLTDQICARDDQIRQLVEERSLLHAELASQSSAVAVANAAASQLEARLAAVTVELDSTLAAFDAVAQDATKWQAIRDQRRRSRALDRVLRKSGVDDSVEDRADVPAGQIGIVPVGSGEVWVLDILEGGSPRRLDAIGALGWQHVASEHSLNGTALVADRRASELRIDDGSDDVSLRFLQHPWSGTVRLRTSDVEVDTNLRATRADVIELRGDGTRASSRLLDDLCGAVTDPVGQVTLHPLAGWLDMVGRQQPAAVAVCHPEWRGIRASMQQLFSYALLLDDVVDDDTAEQVAKLLASAGVPAVVIGGFPRTYRHLVDAARSAGLRVLGTWHGSFMQVGEPYNHASMTDMVDLAMSGAIERVGFVKVGMAETYARRGVPTATLLNYVRTPPAVATPRPVGVRPSIGVWSVAPVWRKIPYAMVAACADLRTPPILHASGADPTLAGLARELGVELHLLGAAVPHDEMARWLAAMHLNLYVTLSECAPMLPLESLAVGVPCLIGPNTHYFDDDPYLHARLVVAEPDRHDRIASAIERVLDERSAIIEHYRTHFYPRHAAAGRHSVLSFLGAADTAVT